MIPPTDLHFGPNQLAGAVCAQVDYELFYADQGGSVRYAKKICAECPVKAACLEFALSLPAHEDRWGVFGGKSERERRIIRSERKKAAA